MSLRIVAGRWHYRFQFAGREHTGTTGLRATDANRPKAEARGAKAHAGVEAGLGDSVRIRPREFEAALSAWLSWSKGEHREHPATYQRLIGSASSLGKFFSGSVALITSGMIEDYKAYRRLTVKEITLRHDLHALSGLLRYCRKQRWLVADPLEDVEIPSDAGAVRIHPISHREELMYFSAAESLSKWDCHDLGKLMLNQGCRPEELLNLRWPSVDLESGKLEIEQGKSRAARRTLKLTATSLGILSRRLQNASAGSPWVFPSPRDPHRPLASCQRAHDRILSQAGLAFVIYDWRHTAATRWARSGMPLPTLAAILGHANLRSIQKYIHISEADMAEAIEKYGDMPKIQAEEVRVIQ